MINPKLCISCKGRLHCGLNHCPILEKFFQTKKLTKSFSKDFTGINPNSVFISWNNYPNVTLAPLSTPEFSEEAKSGLIDNDEKWFGFNQEKIFSLRQSLIRPNKLINVFQASNPDYKLSEMQETVLANKPVGVEVNLEKKPLPSLNFSSFYAPLGPSANQLDFKMTENPSIDKKLDYLVSDTNVKSQTALEELFDYGFSANHLAKVLSAGLLGVKKDRKFVPTRWSISATDDLLSKHLLKKIKPFSLANEIQLFNSNYLDNNFYVLLIPNCWSFEMLESWMPGNVWDVKQDLQQTVIIQDHEFFKGRKTYAGNVSGAYYAARLAVCEHLLKIRRQASCLIFREIGHGYSIPLGVWQIRENVRNALQQKPLTFQDLNLCLKFISTRLKVDFKKYKAKSKLIDNLVNQKRIFEFF